ncbi:MAG: hypothetical protein WC956_09200 [bacterium]
MGDIQLGTISDCVTTTIPGSQSPVSVQGWLRSINQKVTQEQHQSSSDDSLSEFDFVYAQGTSWGQYLRTFSSFSQFRAKIFEDFQRPNGQGRCVAYDVPPDFGPTLMARKAVLGSDEASTRWMGLVRSHLRDAGPAAGPVAKAWFAAFGAFRELNVRYEVPAGMTYSTGPVIMAQLVEPAQLIAGRAGDCRADSLLLAATLSALGAKAAIMVNPMHAIAGLLRHIPRTADSGAY